MQIYDGRKSFYQWDLNQKITGNFTVGDEVHFTNSRSSTALVVKAYEREGKIVADVPNILLQSSYPIIAYRYISVSDISFTIDKQQFEVIQRVKPDDYLYTETEILNYHSLDKRISDLEQNGGSGEINAPVASVNGKIGDVVLTASDVDAYSKKETDSRLSSKADKSEIPTVPTKLSDLEDDSYPNGINLAKRARTAERADALLGIEDVEDSANKRQEIKDDAYSEHYPSVQAVIKYVSKKLETYATKAELTEAIGEALEGDY